MHTDHSVGSVKINANWFIETNLLSACVLKENTKTRSDTAKAELTSMT